MSLQIGECHTYTVIVRLTTDLVRFSGVTGGVTVLLLRDTSMGTIEGLGDILQHIIRLKLTVSRGISRECIVGNILDQGIVPTTAAGIVERSNTCDRWCIAYLLIMRALTAMDSPSIAPLVIKAFCSSKYVTKLGP